MIEQIGVDVTREIRAEFEHFLGDREDIGTLPLLHGLACAEGYVRNGKTPREAVLQALTQNMGFERRLCLTCGDEFPAELGEQYCTHHCFALRFDSADGLDEGCTDGCSYCDTGDKPPTWTLAEGKDTGLDEGELLLPISGGRAFLVFPSQEVEPGGVSYVRMVRNAPGLPEIDYWDCDEWKNDPRGVMGAIMGACFGGY